jgi:drug/metabolite transporter (DMT)-like permease
MRMNPMHKIHASKSRVVHFGMLSLIAGAVMISLSGVWVKVAHVAPNVSAFYRVLFGGIVLLGAALYRRELKWLGARQLILCLLCGFVFAVDLWLYHYSIQYIGPGLGTILPNFQVVFLAAFGILFLREPLRPAYLLSLPLAFVWDVLFFQRPTSPVNWLGVGVALAAIYLGMAGRSAGSR